MNKLFFSSALVTAISMLPINSALAQLTDTASWAATVQNEFGVVPNITYLKANNMELKVDVYRSRNADGPAPTFIYYHGGGWVGGSKEANVLRLMPYLEKGWAAVNVQYRLGDVSLAPAAVEDSLCALRWVARNAEQYGFDVNRLVVSGNSAGGHLALTTGMLPAGSGLDRQCLGEETPSVAAIVNWYGITDVGDLLDGVNQKSYAVRWMGSMPDKYDIASRVSPLNYVSADLPPIISIHGDADPTVPYAHAVQLHEALGRAEVTNELITVPNGRHGGFPANEMLRIYDSVFKFLDKNLPH
ncbi:MAG: alpha/beta hydrolase [Gammaproteobacteria bacterium]|jgi:acetyl esterase/lipase|nr:lipase [Gammaproteobacteria bacterium]MDP6094893.1 alpha/beta hydrolase [Gammaproteobacteria bacterium]HJO11381.1 alpha/beta hydrolase [Gammaproteobacteria bacterium]|tara:strand:- start:8799 stop:9701 length:903 start_codon:yes stop_codon:yes gene_type:complete